MKVVQDEVDLLFWMRGIQYKVDLLLEFTNTNIASACEEVKVAQALMDVQLI